MHVWRTAHVALVLYCSRRDSQNVWLLVGLPTVLLLDSDVHSACFASEIWLRHRGYLFSGLP